MNAESALRGYSRGDADCIVEGKRRAKEPGRDDGSHFGH